MDSSSTVEGRSVKMRRERDELDGIPLANVPTPGMENLPIRSSDPLPGKRVGKPIVKVDTPRKRGRRA